MKSVAWKADTMAGKLWNLEAVLKENLPATSVLKRGRESEDCGVQGQLGYTKFKASLWVLNEPVRTKT